MASFNRVLGLQLALVAGSLVPACQRDSDVSFDDSQLGGRHTAGTANQDPDPEPIAGDGSGGSGSPGTGGSNGGTQSAEAGRGGKPAGGMAGSKGEAGKGGSGPGAAGMSGAGGTGGVAVAGTSSGGAAGMGGTINPTPEPVTVDTRDIDDTYVDECHPTDSPGADARVAIDLMSTGKFDEPCRVRALFNAPLPKVPAGAKVTNVSLTLTCLEAGGLVTASYVEQPWSELLVDWYDSPKLGPMLGSTQCTGAGTVTIDLTDAAAAWLNGKRENYGIYLTTESEDGTEFASSEAKAEASRPVLSLTYVPAAK